MDHLCCYSRKTIKYTLIVLWPIPLEKLHWFGYTDKQVVSSMRVIHSKDSNFQWGTMRHNGVSQEILKHAILDYLVRGIDHFFLKLSNKRMTTDNTTIVV